MLEVLLERVRRARPDVRFSVFARDNDKVMSLGSDVDRIPVEQKSEWAAARAAYLGARRILPSLDWAFRERLPSVHSALVRSKARSLANPAAIGKADVLLVCGGGFLTDVFAGHAWPVLERLQAARAADIPFALMGQGIGPINDRALAQQSREILPFAKLIGVRESLYSVPLLIELGVPSDRIIVTGDDAIEPAYEARSQTTGRSLGLNLRVAEYAGVTRGGAGMLRDPIRAIAGKHSASIISLPVCIADSADTAADAQVIQSLLEDLTKRGDGPVTTASLIERFAECRVVVTGSYHAAVFALAQGIPSVCLFASEYYAMKFRGLANQFGAGCELVSMMGDHFVTTLSDSVDRLWEEAPGLRASLVAAAECQIKSGHAAYGRLAEVMASETSSRKGTTNGPAN